MRRRRQRRRTGLVLSAKTGQGLDALRQRLLEAAGWQPVQGGHFMARQRHLLALGRVARASWILRVNS